MLKYAKAIGANTDVVTAQAFLFPKEENPDQLLVVLATGIGEDCFTTIRKVGLEAQELFFAQENTAQSFEKTVLFIRSELEKLEQYSAVIGFFDKQTLYLETINQFNVVLLRQNHTTQLSSNLESEKLISGMLQEGDRVLFESLPPADSQSTDWPKSLETNLLRTDLEILEDEVESFLQQLPKPDPVAVVLVEVEKEVIPEETSENIPPLVYFHKPKSMDHQSMDEGFEKKRFLKETEGYQPSELHPQTKPKVSSGFNLPKINLQLILPRFSLRGNQSAQTEVSGLPGLAARFPRTFRIQSKKRLILLVLIISLLLFIGGNVLISNFRKNSQFNAKLTSAEQKFDQAMAAKDADPNRAKTLLLEAKASLKEAEAIKPNNGKAKTLDQKINEGTFLIFKQFEQKDFPVFLDLNLIKENFSASRISMSLGKLAVLDSNSKSLMVIDIEKKQPQILAGPLQLGDVQFTSLNGDYVYVFSKDKGILKVDAGNGKTTVEVKPDSEWQRIVDIYGFANNVYLLDEFKNQIWKYIATDNGFSERNQYLRDGEVADFAAARNLQIDGAIWVLKSENTILKFVQGGKDFFQIGEIDPSLDKIKSLYTSDETENLYFLDNENSRVVVTNKKGEYVAQYSGDKFKTANDLVVDEKGKRMYLLGEGKIYQIELK